MRKPEIRYWVLWIFLLGVLFLVFLQVLSGYNLSRITEGNSKLLNELQLQNRLRALESNILIMESDVRGAVIFSNAEMLKDVDVQVTHVREQMKELQPQLSEGVSAAYYQQLEELVKRKISFTYLILQAYEQKGKNSAEAVINTKQGQVIRDSIIAAIASIDRERQAALHTIVSANERTGKLTRLWSIIITGISLIAVILAFWYVLNEGRQQARIIQLLNESDRRSREVAEMKEQFLANMSHEIRTPMSSILGFTNLLRRTTLNDQQRNYVQNIHSAGENLLALVNDILDLSKIEAGMMNLEVVRFSLHSLVSSVAAMFLEKMNEKKLQFEVTIDREVPDILQGDAVRLTQILVNLLSNSVKFTDQGEIRLHVQEVFATDTRTRIRLIISDTGIGIPVEKQQTIFERFHQADAETTRKFGGTGLGLSIVKQLVDLHQGDIRVESVPGEGTSFFVELEYQLPDMEQLFAEAMAAEQEPLSVQKIRALIAEDNPMNQQLISHLMKSWSIEFTIVNNGAEAVEAIKKGDYSIVLMDIQMPEMDGYTATSLIRMELQNDIPIIAMTAHAMTGEKEKCLQLGMNDYVSKPIKETVLYNIIARYAQHAGEVHGEILVSLDYLHQLSGHDAAFEKQILEQFTIQVPEELSALRTAWNARQMDDLRKTAHSMKSTVGYVGLTDILGPVLQRIEVHAAESIEEGMEADICQVEDISRRAVEQVLQLSR